MRLNDPNFPTSTTNPTLTDKALGVIGGLVNLMTFQQIKNLIGITVENVLNSNSAVNALSAAQGKVLNDALALKLNSSAYNEYNKGVYSSLIQLNTAHPTALAGSYALVDTGVGNEADFYWFDLDDGWVTNGGMSLANTDALVEGSSNLYFTNVRAISAVTETINAAVAASLEPTINTQTVTAYTVGTVSTDNDGKTYLRMTNASANTVEVPSTQTKPISIRQAGTGTTTLVAGSGVTLNGTLAFTAQHQTKTICRVSSGIYDVVG